MRIGIDFDNTLVNYDGVFYRSARQLGWIAEQSGQSKEDVKQFFIRQDQELRWTELQGIVYGRDIQFATAYAGVNDTLEQWLAQGATLFVVSHKTRYPIIGDKLDFHLAASQWLQQQDLTRYFEQVYFCPQKETKVKQIAELALDVFIDDLPSILLDPHFPPHTQGILFAPGQAVHTALRTVASWQELQQSIAV